MVEILPKRGAFENPAPIFEGIFGFDTTGIPSPRQDRENPGGGASVSSVSQEKRTMNPRLFRFPERRNLVGEEPPPFWKRKGDHRRKDLPP
jgi:hypothetical protein